MSDDSDCEQQSRRKKTNRINDEPSSSSRGSTRSVKRIRRIISDESDSSDSGSSIEMPSRRKRVPRVTSDDSDTDSSGSVIIKRTKRLARVVSDSGSGDDSDPGFEGSSSSEYGSDASENVSTNNPITAKVQDTGVDSDSSDGQSEKCPICLLSLTTQEIGTPETCEHVFCSECIQEWSKNMNTCPVDRKEYQTIIVRKQINGKVYKQIPIERPNQQIEMDIVEDLTFCEVCRMSDREDRMLLCDGCDLGFHLECLNPPLEEIPTGAWFCNDCSPEDLVNQDVELYELQLLLDDVNAFEMHPRGQRRRTAASTSRLIPRTGQTERVRRRIATNRRTNPPPALPPPVTSSTIRSKKKKKKKRAKARYRTVYEVDEATGETIAIKKRIARRRKRRKRKVTRAAPPKTVKKRLAQQLGMCRPRSVPQNLPDVRVQTHASNIQTQRWSAGIPSVSLFGPSQDMVLFSDSDNEVVEGGLLRRRAPNRSDVAVLRRARVKGINVPTPAVSSTTTDLLDSILDSQTRFHSKNTVFFLGENGKVIADNSRKSLHLNNNNEHVRQRATSTNTTTDNVPSSSGTRSDYQSNTSGENSTAPTSTVETSVSTPSSEGNCASNDERNPQVDCTDGEIFDPVEKEKNKKKENSENNTPRTGTPVSESDIDIYSDIETVSTSKVDDDYKVATPPAPNAVSDEDNNDSETDMVIDTEKPTQESEENTKEETTVTSTVEEVSEPITTVTSSLEIQSEAVQSTSSNQLFSDKPIEHKDDDDDSEDECPNFSIYSKESITLAKNTDITLGPVQNPQIGEISSSPIEEPKVETKEIITKPINNSGGLYSDSEDESVVKRENSFAITDIRNMTEDISEEERSYTPCLDERGPTYREGIEGLDTEMISDEDRNDFDESHDLKTASDGDALEINAKESELDFTRPEDYEEGEIVDKNKKKAAANAVAAISSEAETIKPTCDDVKIKKPIKEDIDAGNKENENLNNNNNNNNNNKESAFKKLSKNSKERNYRDKDRERSKSRERKPKQEKDAKKDRKKEKRKEIERYDVRALIAEKPRRLKDKFGRDIRRSASRSKSRSPSPARRSPSKSRRSTSRSRKRRQRRSPSRSKSRSPERKRSRSKGKKRRRSPSRRRKSRERSKPKTKKTRSRSRHRSRTPTPPKRGKEWKRRQSRDWTPSLSRSRTPERRLTPSWTPPRIMDTAVKPHNLTVILTNDANKKKKEKKRKADKKVKENERQKKRKRSDRTPPPSKEVFASGDNILVSVSFNKETETRDVSTKRKQREIEPPVQQTPDPPKKAKKDKKTKTKPKKTTKDLSGIKPVAIIDLARSPFKELTPSPKDVIILSDSDSEEQRNNNKQKNICDSSQEVTSPERNAYSLGPKTPPEPQIKFTLVSKQTQMRAISNPLHDPGDIEQEGDAEEVGEGHKGPNTPPEPPNSPPSSPDAYDPFEPTKSRSPTPEQTQMQANSTNMDDDNRESNLEAGDTLEKTNNSISQTPEKSHTPPLADVQPADSQSSIHATPESSLGKSPERNSSSQASSQTITVNSSVVTSKPIAQTIPFSSVPTSIITSTPVSNSSIQQQSRINILNTTIITPTHTSSGLPQRIVLPNAVKSSPVKISPTKAVVVKSTPIKPMPSKTLTKSGRKSSSNRNQNGGSDTVDASLSFDSPYSPGSSDYEDLFEPPAESTVVKAKPVKKSPSKVQNAFDALFGTSPFNKIKTKTDSSKNKYIKKPASSQNKGNTKQVGVKLDEDNLKILDDLPNSAVEMQVKDKFLKKLNRQERVVEEVKLVLKPHYNKKHVTKEEYKDILRRAVPKICHNKTGEINPTKIKNLIEAYVKKVRHSKKVTSSSSVNPQKV